MTPREGEGSSRLGWEVSSAGELTFGFTSTSEPDVSGVPAEVYLRALYTSVPFTPAT